MNTTNPESKKEVTEMRKVFYTLGLTVVFNIAATAQKPVKAPGRSIDASATTRSTQSASVSKPSGGSSSLTAVSNVQAQLQNTLDVKNAKVGDQVILKTTQSIKQGSQVIVAKGSQLIGHITEVQQRAKNGAASRLGLVFDQLKNGGMITPISASITSITNASSSAGLDDTLDSGVSGSGSASARSSSSGSTSGGGLLGGVTNTVGGVLNTTTQTVGGVTNTAGQTLGTTTSTVGQTINGLQISTSASGSAQSSTTLSSQNNNVHLEKGVIFSLTVQKSAAN